MTTPTPSTDLLSPLLLEIAAEISNQRKVHRRDWKPERLRDPLDVTSYYKVINDYNLWGHHQVEIGDLKRARQWYLRLSAMAIVALEAIDRHIQKAEQRRQKASPADSVCGQCANKALRNSVWSE